MTYDQTNTESTDNAAQQDAGAQIREAYMAALIPIVREGLALLTEAINDMRHEMALTRQQREECAPLERELRLKQLKAELEDFDLDREEAKLERVERAAEREAREAERKARLNKFKTYTTTKRADINGTSH